MNDFVDALHMLDMIAGRARFKDADFVLSGPLSLMLQGIKIPGAVLKRFTLVSNKNNADALKEALSIGIKPVENVVEENVKGLEFRGVLRGAEVELLINPVIKYQGAWCDIDVSKLARYSMIAQIGENFVRLAPPEFEFLLFHARGYLREADIILSKAGFSLDIARKFVTTRATKA